LEEEEVEVVEVEVGRKWKIQREEREEAWKARSRQRDRINSRRGTILKWDSSTSRRAMILELLTE
jgi:hypothetical protein